MLRIFTGGLAASNSDRGAARGEKIWVVLCRTQAEHSLADAQPLCNSDPEITVHGELSAALNSIILGIPTGPLPSGGGY